MRALEYHTCILILYTLLPETTADDADSDYESERGERLHNYDAELEKADLDRDLPSDGVLKFASLFSKKEMGVQMAMAKFGVQRAKRNVVLRKSCLNQVVCLCVYVLGKGNKGRFYVVWVTVVYNFVGWFVLLFHNLHFTQLCVGVQREISQAGRKSP